MPLIEQLKVARDFGFKIPDTLISTDSLKIKNFFKEHDKIIGKAVKHGFYSQQNLVKIALTKELSEEHITDLASYAPIPMIYQKKINKTYDLRITVIGDKVFPYSSFFTGTYYKPG